MNNRVPDKGVFGLDWNGERRSVPYSIAMFVHGSLKERDSFFGGKIMYIPLNCHVQNHYIMYLKKKKMRLTFVSSAWSFVFSSPTNGQ